jgi:hypothetical protein
VAERLRLTSWAGWLAAGFMALVPFQLYLETSGTWEQPQASLVLLAMLVNLAILHDSQWQRFPWAMLLGALTALGALLSPTLLPAVGLAMLGEFIIQSGRRRNVLVGSGRVMLVAGILIAPWAYRNYRVLGGVVLTRSNFPLELAVGNNEHATGKTYMTSVEDPESRFFRLHPSSSREEQARLVEAGELAYMRQKGQQAREWITQHPWRFLELTAARVGYYWLPPADLWPPAVNRRPLKALVYDLLGLASFVGLVYLFWVRHSYRWLLLAVLLGPSLGYLVTHVEVRYRYPTYWVSALLAGECAGWLAGRFAHPEERSCNRL